uniref:Uncharacterized protein n=1 Tax=Xiphophorus maculatus TaxID=8083 RepID=A0A3B5PUV7_XIPMA
SPVCRRAHSSNLFFQFIHVFFSSYCFLLHLSLLSPFLRVSVQLRQSNKLNPSYCMFQNHLSVFPSAKHCFLERLTFVISDTVLVHFQVYSFYFFCFPVYICDCVLFSL